MSAGLRGAVCGGSCMPAVEADAWPETARRSMRMVLAPVAHMAVRTGLARRTAAALRWRTEGAFVDLLQVVRRVEGLIRKDVLQLLLTALRCASAEELLGSAHVADLVHRVPGDPPAICASFGPLLDLRLTMDRRLSYLSTVAASAHGGDAASDKLRKASYSVPCLLKDHAIMWGYTFVPHWTGVGGICDVVREVLGDMVSEVRSGSQALVRASPATLMRHLLRVKLDDAAGAPAGARMQAAAPAAQAAAHDEVAAAAGVAAKDEGERADVAGAQEVVCAGALDAAVPGVVKEEAVEDAAASGAAEVADAAAETLHGDAGAAVVEGVRGEAAADVADADAASADAPATAGGAAGTDAGDRQGQVGGEGGDAGGVRVKAEPVDDVAVGECAAEIPAGQERLRGAGPGEGAADTEAENDGEKGAVSVAASGKAADVEPAGGEQADAAPAGGPRENDVDVIMLGDTDDDAGPTAAAADAAGGEGGGGEQEGGGRADAATPADADAPAEGGGLEPVAVKQEAHATAAEPESVAEPTESTPAGAGVCAAGAAGGGAPAAHERAEDSAGAGQAVPAAGASDAASAGVEAGGSRDEVKGEAGEVRPGGGPEEGAADDAAGGALVHVIDDDDDSASGDTAVATADDESGGSTGVAAGSGAGGGDGAARGDEWVVLRTTPEELLEEYKARYGVPFPAVGAQGVKEALQEIEWEFEVAWGAGDATLSVRDRLEKQGMQRSVPEEQRAGVREYLRLAHVQCDPSALFGGKPKPVLDNKTGAGGKAAKGGEQVLGKRKEPEGGAAPGASKVVKKGERGVVGPQGRGAGKLPEGVRGRPALMAAQTVRPNRLCAPIRTAVGVSGARGASSAPVPPRRASPMPRADLRPVPVQHPRRPVPPGVLRQPMRMDGPPRHMRSPGRPAVTAVPREHPDGMNKHSRPGYWQPGRPGHGRHDDVGGYVRGSSAQRGGADAGGHRVQQDRYRREPSPGVAHYGRDGYRRRGDDAPPPGGRYVHSGARGSSMLDEPRPSAGRDDPRYDRRAPMHDSAPAHYAVEAAGGVPGMAAAPAGYVTVVPGSVYGGQQVVPSSGGHASGARYAAPSAAQDVQQVQPATVQVLSAASAAQPGSVYRLATVPGGGTVLINAAPAVEGAQQAFPQAYTQYAVDGFGRVQPQQQRAAAAPYDDRTVRHDSGSLQPYSVQV